MLFWIVKSTLPQGLRAEKEDALQLTLIKAWGLGFKYSDRAFINDVMLALLELMDKAYLTVEAAREGLLGSMPGSKLRGLITEELVYAFHVTHRIQPEELDDLEGRVVGMSSSIQAAMACALEQYQQRSESNRIFGEFRARTSRKTKTWTEFMV